MDGRDVRAHGRVLTVYVGLLSVDWCALPCLSVLSPPPLLSHSTRALLLVTAILGGFFVVNLFLAVIFDEFMRSTEIEEAAADDAARVAAAGPAVAEPSVGTAASKETAAARAAKANEKAAAEAAADTSLLPRGAERSDEGDGAEATPGCCTRFCDCAPGESGWRRGLAAIVTSDWFGNCSTALVVINLLVMCMPYAGQSTSYANLVETLGTVITVIFMVEMVLKLIGLGCQGYWSDGWNQLDGCVVGTQSAPTYFLSHTVPPPQNDRASLGSRPDHVDPRRPRDDGRRRRCQPLVSAHPSHAASSADAAAHEVVEGALHDLHGIRQRDPTAAKPSRPYGPCQHHLCPPRHATLRRPVHRGEGLLRLLEPDASGARRRGLRGTSRGRGPRAAFESPGLPHTSHALLLPQEIPRFHFDYFGPAMMSVFIVMIGGWTDPMGAAADVAGTAVAACFFVFVLVVGCYLFMNLFIAILLEAFAGGDEEEDEAEGEDAAPEVAPAPAPAVAADRQPLLKNGTKRSDGNAQSAAASRGAASAVGPPWPADYSLLCFGPTSSFRAACKAPAESKRRRATALHAPLGL